VLSESSELSQLSELIELPEVFSSMEKCLLHQALRPGDPLIKLLELRFVSSSSETSRSSGTIQTSQSSISSHPVFPDEGGVLKSPTPAHPAPNNSPLPQTLTIVTNLNDDSCLEINSLLMYINTTLCIPGEHHLTIRLLEWQIQSWRLR